MSEPAPMTATSLRSASAAAPAAGALPVRTSRRAVCKAPAAGASRPARPSVDSFADLTGMNTELLALTPGFLEALKQVAPKKPRAKVPYVFLLALLAIVGVLAADPSSREFGVTKGREIAARLHRAPKAAPVAPTDAAPPSQVAAAVPPPSPSLAVGPVIDLDPAPAIVSAPVVNVAPAANVTPAAKPAKTAPAAKKPSLRNAARGASSRSHTT